MAINAPKSAALESANIKRFKLGNNIIPWATIDSMELLTSFV